MKPVVLVAASDLHLDHVPPAARAESPAGWYGAMARQLAELRGLCEKHDCPLVVPGDVFNDGWRPHRTPPELVNFVIGEFKKFKSGVYAVPGQHDLPYHRYGDIKKSSYWTLAKAGAFVDMKPNVAYSAPPAALYAFPWGHPADKNRSVYEKPTLHVAVVHRYVWKDGHSFPGCDSEDHVSRVPFHYPGFDVVLFGDNHKGFHERVELDPGDGEGTASASVANCGTFMRRTADEKGYRPFATLVHAGGTLSKHFYESVKHDRWAEGGGESAKGRREDLTRYTETLKAAEGGTEDFPEAVRRELKRRKVRDGVRDAALDSLGGGK